MSLFQELFKADSLHVYNVKRCELRIGFLHIGCGESTWSIKTLRRS